MNDIQKNLLHFTIYELEFAKKEIEEKNFQKIRGIMTFWDEKNDTATITFYYDGEILDNDIEIASDLCAYVISHLTHGMLKEEFVRLDSPLELPESNFWAYKR